MERLLLLI